MRGFFFVAREREGHRQGADTTAVHVDNEDHFCHPVPVGALSGGQSARGEGREGFKQRMKQLDIRLHDREQKTGNEHERRRHHHDGGCFFHQ